MISQKAPPAGVLRDQQTLGQQLELMDTSSRRIVNAGNAFGIVLTS